MTTLAPPPPAPASPPPPLSPGGRTAVRVTLIVAAVVLVVGTVVALGVVAFGLSSFRVVTDSEPLPAGMRSLTVDTGSVPVAVRITTDRNAREPRADLRMVNSRRAGDSPLVLTAGDAEARLTITGESTPFLQWSRGGEITVVLPPDLARRLTVTTQQDNGVVLAQADLDALVARTDNGAVLLSGDARRIDISTDNGRIVTRDPIVVSESFTATTDNGEIEVDFAETAPRTVDVTSGNGDIALAVPARGTYAVDVGTDNGDTDVRVPQVGSGQTAATVITARSSNGDVVVDEVR